MTSTKTDLLIIGGGPAGLSAATFFARVNRPFILYDSQLYRNAQSPEAHTIMGFEGVSPAEYRSKTRSQVEDLYGKGPGGLGNGVFKNGRIVSLEKVDGGFEAVDEDEARILARKVVLATGIKDVLPDIPGKFRLQVGTGTDGQDCKKHGGNGLFTVSSAMVLKLMINHSHISSLPTIHSIPTWPLHC